MCFGYAVSTFKEQVSPAVAVLFRELPGAKTATGFMDPSRRGHVSIRKQALHIGNVRHCGEPLMTASVSQRMRIESVFEMRWWTVVLAVSHIT